MTQRQPLTPKQALIYMLIETSWTEYGHGPSQRWLAEKADRSIATINQLIKQLDRKGYIKHVPNTPNGILLMESEASRIVALIFEQLEIARKMCESQGGELPQCFKRRYEELRKRYTIPRKAYHVEES